MDSLGIVNALYPMPTTLVGATVNGRPNIITIAHVGIMNHGQPQYISIGMAKSHFTNAGIKENNSFSVCIPSENLMKETDYCGIVSGKKADKAALFELFYGQLKTAPMIRQCPVCMECRLERTVDFPNHDVFVGEIVATYAQKEVLDANGEIDIARVKPLLFDMNSKKYWSLGQAVGDCWRVGKQLKVEKGTP